MRKAVIKMPRLNANEDEAVIAELNIAEGDRFDAGALLFAIETTKAANEILAPGDGQITKLHVQKDAMVAVGDVICELLLSEDARSDDVEFEWLDTQDAEESAIAGNGEIQISAKARMIAKKLGINIDDITPVNGAVKVKDVEEFAKTPRATGGATTGLAPAILNKYGPADCIIFGGGGHARAIIDTAVNSGFNIIGAVDAKLPPGSIIIGEYAVLADPQILQQLFENGLRYALVGVGGAVSNAARAKTFLQLDEIGFDLPPLISEHAHLGLGSELGRASYLFSGANVGPAVRIGDNCIINQNVVIAHDSVIGDHVHLAPNAVVAGHCRVGDYSTLGMCATMINGSEIGQSCLIHNGVAVTQDVADKNILTNHGQLDR